MDYGNDSAITRLRNVVNADKSGIFKVNWKGGGDFIYFNLQNTMKRQKIK